MVEITFKVVQTAAQAIDDRNEMGTEFSEFDELRRDTSTLGWNNWTKK